MSNGTKKKYYICGPFLRAILPTTVEASAQAMATDGKTKSTQNSTTKVRFSIKIIKLGQHMIAMTML